MTKCDTLILKNRKVLEDLLRKTNEKWVEHGAEICSDLNLGKTCAGDSCSVSVKHGKCKEDIGSFHIHPSPSYLPSSGDIEGIIAAWEEGEKEHEKLNCISNKNGRLACQDLTQLGHRTLQRIIYEGEEIGYCLGSLLADDKLRQLEILRSSEEIAKIGKSKIRKKIKEIEEDLDRRATKCYRQHEKAVKPLLKKGDYCEGQI